MDVEGLIKKNFPFKDFRIQQYETIEKIISSLNRNKYFILESPTGVGKSVVGYTVTKSLLDIHQINVNKQKCPPVIICTSTKQLQKQYMDSFKNEKNVEFIWSAQNYPCDLHYKSEGTDEKVYFGHPLCAGKQCPSIDSCQYLIQKKKFLKSEVGITNYYYFINNIKLKPLYLICDEAQNLEKILVDMASIILSERSLISFSNNILRNSSSVKSIGVSKFISQVKTLSVKNNINIKNDIVPYVNSFIEHFEPIYEKVTDELNEKRKDFNSNNKKEKENLSKLSKTQKSIENYLEKYKKFEKSKTEWVISERLKERENHKLRIKPLQIFEYFDIHIGNRINKTVYMSATICGFQEFAKSLGIENNGYDHIETKSIIPIKNRTVYYCKNIGSLNFKNKYDLLPKFIDIIDRIIKYQFEKDKSININGIIHSVSYENAEYIKKNSKYKKNIIVPTKNDLIDLNQYILGRKKNTIIVSPSILEGIDLIDELSRFQIFIKVPFGFLGDEWIKTKMTNNKKWYSRDAIIKIVQGCGRSIRSEKDWAETFILDSNFGRLMSYDIDLFPKWFLESVKTVNI